MKIRTPLATAALLLSAGTVRAGIATVSPATPGAWTGTDAVAWFATGQNAKSKGDWELGAGVDPAAPAATADRRWTSGEPTPFTLTYDGDTGAAEWRVGTTSVSFDAPDPFTMLVLSAQAFSSSGRRAYSMLLTDLSLDLMGDALGTMALPGLSASTTDPAVHLTIAEADTSFSGGFTLTGTATMTWTGAAPTEDRIAFSVLGVGAPAEPALIPTPGSAVLAAGGVGLLRIRRRR